MKKPDLINGAISRTLLQLTLPQTVGILSLVTFNLVDTFFVAKLGHQELAALSFTFPVITVVFGLVQGLGMATTALVSKSMGAKDHGQASLETTYSIVLSIFLAGIFILIGLSTMDELFRLLNASEEIIPLVKEYMTIWYLAIFFVVIPFVGNNAIRSTGDAITPSLIMMFAVLVNAILDPLLIFGYGIFPELGLKGAAIATAISRGLTMVLSLLILKYREKMLCFNALTMAGMINIGKKLLYISIPTSMSRMLTPVILGFLTAFLAKYGEGAVAAYGVGTRIEFLITSILIAMAASMAPFAGQNLGANKPGRIIRAINICARFNILWAISCGLIFIIFHTQIISIFTQDSTTSEYLKHFIFAVLPVSGFYGISLMINAVLNTGGRPFIAFYLQVIQMVVLLLPLAYYLQFHYSGYGIFYAISAAYLIGGLINYFVGNKILRQPGFSQK